MPGTKGRLAVERMTDRALYDRLQVAIICLEPGRISINVAEKLARRGAYNEAKDIVRELKLRGTQLSLADVRPIR
jgi:hypothetical protein